MPDCSLPSISALVQWPGDRRAERRVEDATARFAFLTVPSQAPYMRWQGACGGDQSADSDSRSTGSGRAGGGDRSARVASSPGIAP